MENNRLKTDVELEAICCLGCSSESLKELSLSDCMRLLEFALNPNRPVGLQPEGRMRVEARVKHLHKAGFR